MPERGFRPLDYLHARASVNTCCCLPMLVFQLARCKVSVPRPHTARMSW